MGGHFQIIVRSGCNFPTLFRCDRIRIAQQQLLVFFNEDPVFNCRIGASIMEGNAVKMDNIREPFFRLHCRSQRGKKACHHGQAKKERGQPRSMDAVGSGLFLKPFAAPAVRIEYTHFLFSFKFSND